MKKRILAVVASLVLALGITLVAADPAAASYSQCPAGTGCVYIDNNGTGAYFVIAVSVYKVGLCWNFSNLNQQLVNSISSAIDTYGSGIGTFFYNNRDCSTTNGDLRLPHMSHTDSFVSTWCTAPGFNCNDNAESFELAYI